MLKRLTNRGGWLQLDLGQDLLVPQLDDLVATAIPQVAMSLPDLFLRDFQRCICTRGSKSHYVASLTRFASVSQATPSNCGKLLKLGVLSRSRKTSTTVIILKMITIDNLQPSPTSLKQTHGCSSQTKCWWVKRQEKK